MINSLFQFLASITSVCVLCISCLLAAFSFRRTHTRASDRGRREVGQGAGSHVLRDLGEIEQQCGGGLRVAGKGNHQATQSQGTLSGGGHEFFTQC